MKDNVFSIIGNSVAVVFTAIQTNEILQYISLGLTIFSVCVTIAYNIYKWYKKASADGKITEEEIKEGVDIIKDGINEAKDQIDKKGKK